MVPFERVVAQLRSLYPEVQEMPAGTLFDGDAPERAMPGGGGHVRRYDTLLADAAAMLEAACPPLPFTSGDRAWLEETLAGLGLDVRASSAR